MSATLRPLHVVCLVVLAACATEGARVGARAGAQGGSVVGLLLGSGDPLHDMILGAVYGGIGGAVIGGAVEHNTPNPGWQSDRRPDRPLPIAPEDTVRMGEINQRALQLLVECRHLETYERLSVSQSSSDEPIRLAAIWIWAVATLDHGDYAHSERHFARLVDLDPDIHTRDQAREATENALDALYRSRRAQGRPERCDGSDPERDGLDPEGDADDPQPLRPTQSSGNTSSTQ